MTRGQIGRELALVEIKVAVAVVVAAGLLAVVAPHGSGGMFRPLSDWPIEPTLAVGLVGLAVGFAWMIRIYRANPEPDPHHWRYRNRG